MSRRKKSAGPADGQLELDFSGQFEAFAEAAERVVHLANNVTAPEWSGDSNIEAELHVEIAAACKLAIKESGLSREQVLDSVNAYLGRAVDDQDRTKPITVHVFNNHLSKPREAPMRASLVHAICRATGSFRPYEALVGDLGGRVIGTDEVAELQLGKIQQLTAEMAKVKRDMIRALSARNR